MSYPTPGDPQDEPTRRYDPVPPEVVPTPPPQVPGAAGPVPTGAGPTRRDTRLTVEAGRFWAGVVATALVAALVGVVGVIVLEQILRIDLVYRDPFGYGSAMAAFITGGVVVAVGAGAMLHLLVLTTPRPKAFFGWILGLATLVATLLPLTWTDNLGSAVATGVVNLLMGIAVWSLLTGVLGWTVRRVVV